MGRNYSVDRRVGMLGALCVLLLVLAFFVIRLTKEAEVLEYSDAYVAMAELPSQLSFTYFGEDAWEERVKEINGGKNLEGKLTYGKLELLLEQLSVQDYVEYETQASRKDVSRAQWDAIYGQVLDLLDMEGRVSSEDVVFLEKDEDGAEKEEDEDGAEKKDGGGMDREKDGESMQGEGDGKGAESMEGEKDPKRADEACRKLTQKGYFEVAGGVDYFHYYDMYQVYVMDGRIIGIKGKCQELVTMENVFIHRAGEGQAAILYQHQEIALDIEGLEEEIQDTICNITWEGSKVAAIYKKQDVITGKVLSFDSEKIEISGYGALRHGGDLKIYKTYGTVEELDESKLVVGNLQADFVVAGKDVCGIILKEPASIENIRVLLLNGDGGIYHADPMFVADAGGTVEVGDQKKKIKKNRLIHVSEFFSDEEDYVKISLKKKEGRVYFSNGEKERVSLGYRGTIEIRKYPQGYGVVNELPLEQYLYGVVPSEMPASYEREALCVQAVCARSYAYIQLLHNSYAAFGAHVDDSTNYQVYNKQAEDPRTNLAVDDTVGEVIKYRGEVAEAYFFSTSCGLTQDTGVWNLQEGADGAHGYLKGISLLSEEAPDFSKEKAFARFIKSKKVKAYDSDSPYFRWEAVLDVEGRLEAVNEAIASRRQANPANVQILKENGEPGTEGDLPGFGKITKIAVKEREEMGCVRRLCITYEKGSAELLTEYNTRYVLGSAAMQVTDQEGNAVDMALLPSACCMAKKEGKTFRVYGGGYGHGLGMCQNGANGMAKEGMRYTEILGKFYHEISIENIYNGKEE